MLNYQRVCLFSSDFSSDDPMIRRFFFHQQRPASDQRQEQFLLGDGCYLAGFKGQFPEAHRARDVLEIFFVKLALKRGMSPTIFIGKKMGIQS